MLCVDAIRVLEKVARARFDLASMPRKEEIEEAIPIVAGMVTVQASRSMHFTPRCGGWRSNPKRWNSDEKR